MAARRGGKKRGARKLMTDAPPVHRLRLSGVAGSNKVMAGELSRLARRRSVAERLGTPRKEGTGALVYDFDEALAITAANYHRTCVRVLWDVMESRAPRLELCSHDRGLQPVGCH